MLIRRFEIQKDLESLSHFLRELYDSADGTSFWLPARLQDLLFRIAAQERADGREISGDYIWIKNRFRVIREVAQDGGTVLLAERWLSEQEACYGDPLGRRI